jgi:hypothetical protein
MVDSGVYGRYICTCLYILVQWYCFACCWHNHCLFHAMPLPLHFGGQGWPIPKRVFTIPDLAHELVKLIETKQFVIVCLFVFFISKRANCLIFSCVVQLPVLFSNLHQVFLWIKCHLFPAPPHETCDSLVAAGPFLLAPIAAVCCLEATSSASGRGDNGWFLATGNGGCILITLNIISWWSIGMILNY